MRQAGILLHPTSLPTPGGLGVAARAWIDWLKATGCSLWAVLPLHPPSIEGNPYDSPSVSALDTRLIDPKSPLPSTLDVDCFAKDNPWLEDWALFEAVRCHLGVRGWFDFPQPLADREAWAIQDWTERLKAQIQAERQAQCQVVGQWAAIKDYAAAAGVRIVGDLPLFVCRDGVDTWVRPDLFCLNDDGRPDPTTGAPPDLFNDMGQWWNHPHYAWPAHLAEGFAWWCDRFRLAMERHHTVRIDHFRGLVAAWAIPASAGADARSGAWRATPGEALMRAVSGSVPDLSAIAEDLGDITPEVITLREKLKIRGMKVLQFAFDGPNSPHRPPFVGSHWVVYPGTHDNNTTRGWYDSANEQTKAQLDEHLGSPCTDPARSLINLAWESRADWAIAPLQDLLGLDAIARMNTPGVKDGNWCWVAEALPPTDWMAALNRRTERHAEEV